MGERITDAAVIVASGSDPGRFGAVFDRHFGAIHRYARRRIGSTGADDVAAETFLIAFRRRAAYDRERADARPWLFGIAANLLRRHRRAEVRRLRAYARTGVDAVVEDADGAEERADAAAFGPRLARALASLSARDRETLLLYAWADLSYEEIGRALGIPKGTVRSRLSRARRLMRGMLDAEVTPQDRSLSLEGGSDG